MALDPVAVIRQRPKLTLHIFIVCILVFNLVHFKTMFTSHRSVHRLLPMRKEKVRWYMHLESNHTNRITGSGYMDELSDHTN